VCGVVPDRVTALRPRAPCPAPAVSSRRRSNFPAGGKLFPGWDELSCEAGYRTNTEVIRPANEVRFQARWRLGQLLAKIERQQVIGPGRGKKTVSRVGTPFRAYLREIGRD
jgi:hypothetical protein